MKVVILAGGQGKRLRPLTDRVPKPLVEINGTSIIDHQIDAFRKLGADSFVVLTGYRHDDLVDHFSKGYDWADISFSFEEEPLGTGGALKAAEEKVGGSDFMMINGDIMTDIDMSPLLKGNDEIIGKISLVPLRSPYGVIKTNSSHIIGFEEKPLLGDIWINAGMYWFANKIFGYLPKKGDIEKLVFPKLAEDNLLGFCKFGLERNFWSSIDTLKDYEEIDNLLKTKKSSGSSDTLL